MHKKSSRSTGQLSLDLATSKTLGVISSRPSTSLQADSLAKTSVSQEREKASQGSVPVSGESSRESSTNLDPSGCLLKTCRPFEQEGSPLSSATFTRSGTMRSGMVYPLVPSAPLTGVTGSSLLPTLTVSGNYNRAGVSPRSGDGLCTVIGGALNPTWAEWFMGFPLGWTDLEG